MALSIEGVDKRKPFMHVVGISNIGTPSSLALATSLVVRDVRDVVNQASSRSKCQ